jgi:hypothetical protein
MFKSAIIENTSRIKSPYKVTDEPDARKVAHDDGSIANPVE